MTKLQTNPIIDQARVLLAAACAARAEHDLDSWQRVKVGDIEVCVGRLADCYLEAAKALWVLIGREDQEALGVEFGVRSNCSWK